MKLLKEKYKTYDGALKRAAFENAMAPGEFKRGDKARVYRYVVVSDPAGEGYRVERRNPPAEFVAAPAPILSVRW
jgi:hypothetical protein